MKTADEYERIRRGEFNPRNERPIETSAREIRELRIELMDNSERDRKLKAFAFLVLKRLQSDEQWNADTLEALQSSAFELGIAETKNNFFHVKKEFQS